MENAEQKNVKPRYRQLFNKTVQISSNSGNIQLLSYNAGSVICDNVHTASLNASALRLGLTNGKLFFIQKKQKENTQNWRFVGY